MNLFNKKIFLIISGLLIAAAIPITMYLAQQRQDIRQRAGGGVVSFETSPPTLTKAPGETFEVQILLVTNAIQVTGIDLQLIIDPAVLEFVSMTPASGLNEQLINTFNVTTGTLRYVAVDTAGSFLGGTAPVATLTLKGKTAGTGTIMFQDSIQVVAQGNVGLVGLGTHTHGSYIVAIPPTPTPTPLPPTNTPTPTPLPTPTAVPPTNTPTPTSAPTPTLIVTGTPIPTTIPTPTNIPIPTDAPIPTNTPIPQPTNTPIPTSTPVPPTATPTPVPQQGDISGDGVIDIQDFNNWRDVFIGVSQNNQADVNSDGQVDLIDFNIWRTAFLGL